MSLFKDAGHLFRFAGLFVVVFLVFLGIRGFVVPKSFGQYDHYRGDAIKDAQAKAAVLAKQLGVHLGKVVSFSENGGYPVPMYASYKGGVAMDARVENAVAPSLPTGQNETDVTVSITYEIR